MAMPSPRVQKSRSVSTTLTVVAVFFFVGVGTGFFLAVNKHLSTDPNWRLHGGDTELLDAPVIRQPIQTQSEPEIIELSEPEIQTNLRGPETVAPLPIQAVEVKPTTPPSAEGKPVTTPCLWTELKDLATDPKDFTQRVVVASSHGTSEGTSFLVLGNTTKIQCGAEPPMRDIILSDPPGTNKFNIHRIDCPPETPLNAGSQSCPAVPRGTHPGRPVPSEAKNVICLAPLYDAQNYGRW